MPATPFQLLGSNEEPFSPKRRSWPPPCLRPASHNPSFGVSRTYIHICIGVLHIHIYRYIDICMYIYICIMYIYTYVCIYTCIYIYIYIIYLFLCTYGDLGFDFGPSLGILAQGSFLATGDWGIQNRQMQRRRNSSSPTPWGQDIALSSPSLVRTTDDQCRFTSKLCSELLRLGLLRFAKHVRMAAIDQGFGSPPAEDAWSPGNERRAPPLGFRVQALAL